MWQKAPLLMSHRNDGKVRDFQVYGLYLQKNERDPCNIQSSGQSLRINSRTRWTFMDGIIYLRSLGSGIISILTQVVIVTQQTDVFRIRVCYMILKHLFCQVLTRPVHPFVTLGTFDAIWVCSVRAVDTKPVHLSIKGAITRIFTYRHTIRYHIHLLRLCRDQILAFHRALPSEALPWTTHGVQLHRNKL